MLPPTRASRWRAGGRNRDRLAPYLLAIATTALAIGLRSVLDPYTSDPLLILFVLPVLVTALYGGTWPGLTAAILSALAVEYFVLPPLHSIRPQSSGEAATWVVFIVVAALTGSLSGRLMTARERTAAAEARFRGLFEGIADPVLVSHADGRIVDANPAAAQLLGYSRAELCRLRLDTLAPEAGATPGGLGQAAPLRAAFVAGEWRHEMELRRKDGTLAPVEVVAAVATLPAGDDVAITTLRDISERRALERLQREFLVMITHDLKAPLTSIRGYADLMLRRASYNERGVTAIIEQSRQLERLMNDLLDAARMEAGQLELRRGPAELVAVARASVEAAQARTTTHQLRLDAPDAAIVGDWDRGRLEQVLQNLLSNAIKYSPQGGDIVVSVRQRADDAQVTVRDQGVGMPPEALSRLFTRFQRLDSPLTAKVEGLGLGLFITRSLVEAHGGRVWVESRPGEGSTFGFSLPCGRAASSAAPAETAAAAPRDVSAAT